MQPIGRNACHQPTRNTCRSGDITRTSQARATQRQEQHPSSEDKLVEESRPIRRGVSESELGAKLTPSLAKR